LPPPENSGAILFAARPSLIRAMNEQLLLEHIRQRGPCSRAELARVSGLSKPTVSLALDNVERAGLVRIAGQRTGVPGRSARLYEIRPDAGLVLGLDIGHEYVRGAIADLSGEIRARQSVRAHATSVRGRVAELVGLADLLCESVGVVRPAITQTVIGSPGVYDPRRNAMKLTGGLRGWDLPGQVGDRAADVLVPDVQAQHQARVRPDLVQPGRPAGHPGPLTGDADQAGPLDVVQGQRDGRLGQAGNPGQFGP
jgi:DNA-binding transcriptional ArsR family regulator